MSRKYCIVPLCRNTSATAPNKFYFAVPRKEDIRKKWCTAMNRDENKNKKLSNISTLYCCEDHFDFKEDLVNYIQFRLMPNIRPRLKKGIIPHVFECQRSSFTFPRDERIQERKRHHLEQETLQDLAVASTSTSKFTEIKVEAMPTEQIQTNTLKIRDKAIQVRPSYRNKMTNTKISYIHQPICSFKVVRSPIKTLLRK